MLGQVYLENGVPSVSTSEILINEYRLEDEEEIGISNPGDLFLRSDSLVNARNLVSLRGSNVWSMDESVVRVRAENSRLVVQATGLGSEGDGLVHISRSELYYFRALLAAMGEIEISAPAIGVFGTISVEGALLEEGEETLSRVLLDADQNVLVTR